MSSDSHRPWYADVLPAALGNQDLARSRISARSEPVSRLTIAFQHGGMTPRHQLVATPADDEAEYPGLWDGFHAITYVIAGRGMLHEVLDHARPVTSGSLVRFHCAPGEGMHLDASGDLLECTVCVDSACGRRLAADGLWPASNQVVDIGQAPALLAAFVRLYEVMGDRTISHAGLRWRLLELIELIDGAVAGADPDAGLIARAKLLFEEHPEPSFSTADAAQRLGCTLDQLRRRFQTATGVSPARWQLHRRLERASELLTTHSVQAVAALLGYTDPAVFSRQYRAHLGQPPSTRQRRQDRDTQP